MSATWPDPDPGWRVRTGVSLVEFMPMSDERRELIRRESEREAQAAELEAQQAREAAYEKRWELERHGVVPVSVADRLAMASFGMDRADKAEEKREREAAELLGRPEPRTGRPPRWEIAAKQRELDDYEQSPATIPATSEATFLPAFAPRSVGTLKCSPANRHSPARSANASTGTSPAADTRRGSSNTADTAENL